MGVGLLVVRIGNTCPTLQLNLTRTTVQVRAGCYKRRCCDKSNVCMRCFPRNVCRMIVNDMPPRLPSVYTADFEDLVYRMLDKDADKRPSITQLLELPSVQVRVRGHRGCRLPSFHSCVLIVWFVDFGLVHHSNKWNCTIARRPHCLPAWMNCHH